MLIHAKCSLHGFLKRQAAVATTSSTSVRSLNRPLLWKMGFAHSPAPIPGPLPDLLDTHPALVGVLPGPSVQQPHLVDHHASLEDGHEVRWLLAHRDSDLGRFIVVLLIQDDGLIGRGCDFILAGLPALGMSRMQGVG